ncbi:MAG: hypothetical protein JWO69_1610 [Thermoleophilia bacterium]|nr:hypothetical protein [Thermoleophilia bacterium]
MSADPDSGTDGASPRRRLAIPRRLLKLLVVVDVVLLVVILAIWLAMRDDDRENVVNDGLRGSLPPAGEVFPDVASVGGIRPKFPTGAQLAGTPVVLVATCVDCRSGDIIGGFLSRLGAEELPDTARVLVVGWNGDVGAWRRTWKIPRSIEVHGATNVEATARVRSLLRTGESGNAFLHDTRGIWRASYALGQLDVDDVLHDLDELGAD